MADDKPIDAGAPEIEVTPAMIDAGADALWRSCAIEHPCEADREIVRSIFTAMLSASSFEARGH